MSRLDGYGRTVRDVALVSRVGEIVTVTVHGDADYSAVTALIDSFENARALPGVRRIRVDLAAVRFMDSTALGVLVSAFRFARQDGLTFTVVNPSPNVQKLLEIIGVAHLLTAPGDDHEDRE